LISVFRKKSMSSANNAEPDGSNANRRGTGKRAIVSFNTNLLGDCIDEPVFCVEKILPNWHPPKTSPIVWASAVVDRES
jgi:hypothetical protein